MACQPKQEVVRVGMTKAHLRQGYGGQPPAEVGRTGYQPYYAILIREKVESARKMTTLERQQLVCTV